MLTKIEANAIADSLLPCPFCGEKLQASIRGPQERAINPKALCHTEDCMGAALPVISLDVPAQVAAWNTPWRQGASLIRSRGVAGPAAPGYA